jgi:hypothetical protein
MLPKVTWPQALAWRMRRHLLDPIGTQPVASVVRRLCGVQAQVASAAEMAVRVRRRSSRPGEAGRALSQGWLVKTWAMRGTLHLLTPQEGGIFLSLLAASRTWELPSWQRYFGVTPESMDRLRLVIREALDGEVLSREELIEAITRARGLEHIGEGLRSGWGTLLKPAAWQGDLCFGPSRGTRVTFTHPTTASPRWAGLPHPDEAAPLAIAAYLGAYGPAPVDAFSNWMGRGRRSFRSSFAAMGDRVAEVDVEGVRARILAEDVDDLLATKPTKELRLLPGFDQYVLGPGTGDPHVVPTERRSAVSRQSGWIAPVVVWGGVVAGTWEVDEGRVRVDWFGEAGRMPKRALGAEVARMASILDRDLDSVVTVT